MAIICGTDFSAASAGALEVARALAFKRGDREVVLVHVVDSEGEVIWVNPFRPGAPDNLHPGMGIRFVDLDDDVRDRLLELVRRFAYLT